MFKVTASHILLAFFLQISLSPAHAVLGGGGGMDSGGGSGLILIFRNEGMRAANLISQLKTFPITAEEFKTLVRTTRLEISTKPLVDKHGKETLALVNYSNKSVRLHQEALENILFIPKSSLKFVVHLYLEAAGIEDQKFKYSRLLEQGEGDLNIHISCESRSDDSVTKVIYQESISKKTMTIYRSALLSLYINNSKFYDFPVPIISQNDNGILLVLNHIPSYPSNLLLPTAFLNGTQSKVKIPSYIISAAPFLNDIPTEFSCEHVKNDDFLAMPAPSERVLVEITPEIEEFSKIWKTVNDTLLKRTINSSIADIAKLIPKIPDFPLNEETFLNLVKTTTLEFTDEILLDADDNEVDALNHPSRRLIQFNRLRVSTATMSPHPFYYQLILHEYLGIAGIDDKDYSVSEKILPLFDVTMLELNCQTDKMSKEKIHLRYRELDYDRDGAEDFSEITALTSTGSDFQQTPLISKIFDFSDDLKFEMKGMQFFWVSEDSQKTYQTFLPWKVRGKSNAFKVPYFVVSPAADQRVGPPVGQLQCVLNLEKE